MGGLFKGRFGGVREVIGVRVDEIRWTRKGFKIGSNHKCMDGYWWLVSQKKMEKTHTKKKRQREKIKFR